jgi:DnaJ-class molecular chaperone
MTERGRGRPHKFPACATCGGRGWQWYKRRSGEHAWGHCPSCHGFGVSLVALAEHLSLDRRKIPQEPGEA